MSNSIIAFNPKITISHLAGVNQCKQFILYSLRTSKLHSMMKWSLSIARFLFRSVDSTFAFFFSEFCWKFVEFVKGVEVRLVKISPGHSMHSMHLVHRNWQFALRKWIEIHHSIIFERNQTKSRLRISRLFLLSKYFIFCYIIPWPMPFPIQSIFPMSALARARLPIIQTFTRVKPVGNINLANKKVQF